MRSCKEFPLRTPVSAFVVLLLACAAPGAGDTGAQRPAPPRDTAPFSQEVRDAIQARRVLRGMDATALGLAWGKPDSIDRRPSASAQGLVYERWRWSGGSAPAREAVLVNGRVIDAWSQAAGP
jgi:hypothetical protein